MESFLHIQWKYGKIIQDVVKSPRFQPHCIFSELLHDNVLKSASKTTNINIKNNCSLYTLLTATEQKPQNHKKLTTAITLTFRRYCSSPFITPLVNITFL